jgi:hypothetical protein
MKSRKLPARREHRQKSNCFLPRPLPVGVIDGDGLNAKHPGKAHRPFRSRPINSWQSCWCRKERLHHIGREPGRIGTASCGLTRREVAAESELRTPTVCRIGRFEKFTNP